MSAKLDTLTEKRNQIDAQIKALKAKENTQQRKDETRRKILIGSVIIKRVKDGFLRKEELTSWLNEGLTRDQDRKHFKLPILKGNDTLGT